VDGFTRTAFGSLIVAVVNTGTFWLLAVLLCATGTALAGSEMALGGVCATFVLSGIVITAERLINRRVGVCAAMQMTCGAVAFAEATRLVETRCTALLGECGYRWSLTPETADSLPLAPIFAYGALSLAVGLWWALDRRLDRWLRILAMGLVAAVGGLVVFAVVRAVRLPDREGYWAAMPVVAVVSPIELPDPAMPHAGELPTGPFLVQHFGRFRLERVAGREPVTKERACETTIYDEGAGGVRVGFVGVERGSCNGFEVRGDERHDVWNVGSRLYSPRGGAHGMYDVPLAPFRASLSAPRGWIWGAATGWMVAIAALGAGVRLGRKGSREASESQASDEVAVCSAFALATIALTCVPLVSAALQGLVF